jgi:hypothetical protein
MTTKTLHHSRPFLDVLDPTEKSDLGIPQPQHLVHRHGLRHNVADHQETGKEQSISGPA